MSKEQTLEFLGEKAVRLSQVKVETKSPSEMERVTRALKKTQRRIRRIRKKSKGLDKACEAISKFLRKLDPENAPAKPVNPCGEEA